MFDLICPFAAICLAAFSQKQYRFIALLVAFEFILHNLTYSYLFLDIRSNNSGLIYVLYMGIQAFVLWIMYMRQTHFIIAGLIFLNLVYNFFLVLQFTHITGVDFYAYKSMVIMSIMVLELLYLLGITTYVSVYLKRNGYLDIDDIDSLFLIFRRPYGRRLVQGDEV